MLLLGLADSLGAVERIALAVESHVAHLPGNLRDGLGDLLLAHLDLVGREQQLRRLQVLSLVPVPCATGLQSTC